MVQTETSVTTACQIKIQQYSAQSQKALINMENDPSFNVLGSALQLCSLSPLTGYFRTGACDTCSGDTGSHTVCAIMTEEFLAFSKYVGNDLSTPNPDYGFAGLKTGDQWCLCAMRFLQAHDEGCAPHVNLFATHVRALEIVAVDVLRQYSIEPL